MKRLVTSVTLTTLLVLQVTPPLAAQELAPTVSAPADTGKVPASRKTLFTSRDAWLAAGFAGLTVAMFPLDRHLAHTLRDSSLQSNRFLSDISRGAETLVQPGAIIIGAGLYTVGRIGGWRNVADLGWHGTESIIVASAATTVLKGMLGRARPYVSSDTNPHDFGFGRGFGKNGRYQSFPSGHTTAAFAVAAAVTSESRRFWPGHEWVVAPVMYGGATLVGLSRIYHDAHWASDVALGAAIGTFGGLKVVRYSHHHPDNFVDRIMLPMRVVPTTQGASILWTIPVGRAPVPGNDRAAREDAAARP
ncbi:MAG TPA: phosphatase PAP2 family protein [Gemmatimonadaceae bacterium]|nr:phosphatase PAP2 family protein [Gemmatimonadaceae bacterium]